MMFGGVCGMASRHELTRATGGAGPARWWRGPCLPAILVSFLLASVVLAPLAAAQPAPEPQPPPPASWMGATGFTIVATDDAGAPVPGVRVILRLGDSTLGLRAPDTDAQGRSVVEGLAEGEWQIDLQRDGFMLVTAYVRLVNGKRPEVAFSSRQRTGSFWAPLNAVYLDSEASITAAVAAGRSTPKEAKKAAQRAAEQARREEQRLEKERRRGRGARLVDPEPTKVASARPKKEPAPRSRPPSPEKPSPEGKPAPEPAGGEPPAPKPGIPVSQIPEPQIVAPQSAEEAAEPGPAPTASLELPLLLRNPTLLPAGACPECRPGEWSVTAELEAAPVEAAGCDASSSESLAGVAQTIASALDPTHLVFAGALRAEDGNDVLRLLAPPARAEIAAAIDAATAPTASCPVVGVVLPTGARYIGFRYRAAERRTEGECLPDQPCQIGSARWLGPPMLSKTDSITLVHGQFENQSAEHSRRAMLTVYFVPPRGWLPPG